VERPIILCGLGRMGTKVLEYLEAAALPVVVIDNTCREDDPRLRGARLVFGDCRRREVLEAAGVADARGVLILTGNDLLNITTTLLVRSLNPEVRVVLRMFNQHLIGRLGQTVRNVFALSTSLLTAPILALTAMTGQALAAFALDSHAEGRRQIIEVPVGPTSDLRGRTVGEVIGPRDAVAVAHLCEHAAGGPAWRMLLDVDLEARLQAGDRLVVCGEPRALAALLASAGEGDVPDLMWAGWGRRMGRVCYRTFADMDRAVRICALVFLAVVLLSTLVLSVKYQFSHAFLRSVSIMATAGALDREELKETPGLEVFVSLLRIVGVVLTAAFTAIVTNYLIRQRLGGALELRRIPDGGHHVVCGLGTVGFRVIEELAGYGERVVAIERDPQNRFVTTARRLGVAVIIGDAAVNEVLRQAHAGTAHAVIAATNNDLVNLAVALQVREMNPHHRVVLLLSDPQFAQMVDEATQVQLAASVPALVAPAFLAALFGDRVQSVFQIADKLFAVVHLVIQATDPLAGHAVRAVAVDYGLQPVALVPAEGPRPRPVLAARLAAGDRLVALCALSDLEPVLRRQPASAAFAVEVTACPLPQRGWLAGLVRTYHHTSQEDAEKSLDHLPLRLGGNLTRGEAEDLLARLARERVAAHLVPMDGNEANAQGSAHG
jgi:Trk K+ transport system NAD-binding subunit